MARDQRRPRVSDGFRHRTLDVVEIMAIAFYDMPSGGRIARGDIFAGRQIHSTIDGNPVIIPQNIQSSQAEMTGKANCLVVDTFHQASVACDHPGFMVDEFVTEHGVQMPLGNCHTNGHRQTLPQRTGRGFNTFEFKIFRVARTWAVQLAEIADVIHRRLCIAGQVQGGVGQHGTMSGG